MEVKRATFEQVNKSQLSLIFDHIQLLADKNETISEESRKDYFELLGVALLGRDLAYDFILDYDGGNYNLGSVAVFSRKMAFFEDTDDGCQTLELKGSKIKVPNSILWEALRLNIYKPMAEALTLALKSSAEILRSGSVGYGFEPENEIE